MKKLMVFGMKRHGKDTLCEYLRDKYGFSFASSSETANKIWIFDKYKDQFGYATEQECFEDRDRHRDLWYNEICDFCKDDLARLGRIIFAENDIYCGIRDQREFREIELQDMFDLSIYVDASERLPPEPSTSNNLDKSYADIVITNNGSLEEFYEKIDALVVKHDLMNTSLC